MNLNRQTYPAPAKLNLFLHVIGRRADGYHLLQTVFRLIDYGDTLAFSLRPDGALMHANPIAGVPADQDLCIRAARLLKQASGCSLGVEISIDKRLPLGGGLGGGSSDAATTLLALNRLWELGLSRQRLMELGLKLGADVPVFIFGQNAFAEGVGEKLQAIVLPPRWYLVLVPPVQVSTAAVFASTHLTRNTNPLKIFDFSEIELGRNDLEPVVCGDYPEVAYHLGWLRQFGRAQVTGSGACVFAEFATESDARAALAQLPAAMRGFVARGLDRHPLREFADD